MARRDLLGAVGANPDYDISRGSARASVGSAARRQVPDWLAPDLTEAHQGVQVMKVKGKITETGPKATTATGHSWIGKDGRIL